MSMNRALNCTRDMACSHLDALAQELIDTGIFTNAKQIQAGVWTGKIDVTRAYNHDEHHNSSTMAWTVLQMGLFMQGAEIHAKQ